MTPTQQFNKLLAEFNLMTKLSSEVIEIASSGKTPDGYMVNISTLVWAKEWAAKMGEKP